MLVDAKLPNVKFDARDSCELARDKRDLREIGDNETLLSGTKSPRFGSHLKYLMEVENVRNEFRW